MEKHRKQDGLLYCLYCEKKSLGSGQGTCPVKQLPIMGLNSEYKSFYSWSAKRAVQEPAEFAREPAREQK